MYEGRFYTFPPKTFLDRTELTVIRPLMYVSEADVIGFKNKYQLPVCKNPCPADGHTKREYVKNLTKQLNKENPGIKERLFHAVVSGNIDGWALPGQHSPAAGQDLAGQDLPESFICNKGGILMATLSYHEQKDIENIKKLRELQKELPSFCSDFFRGIETSTSTRTRIAYAYDLKIFFQFLKTANPGTFNNPAHTLTPADLEKLTVTDLEEYIDYLKCHPGETSDDIVNTERRTHAESLLSPELLQLFFPE